MVLTLLIARPFDQALAVVGRVYIPMIVANAIGMYVFCIMVENIRKERELQAEHDARVREKIP
jgi:LytS/YehU family sensor histidine kinase